METEQQKTAHKTMSSKGIHPQNRWISGHECVTRSTWTYLTLEQIGAKQNSVTWGWYKIPWKAIAFVIESDSCSGLILCWHQDRVLVSWMLGKLNKCKPVVTLIRNDRFAWKEIWKKKGGKKEKKNSTIVGSITCIPSDSFGWVHTSFVQTSDKKTTFCVGIYTDIFQRANVFHTVSSETLRDARVLVYRTTANQ